MPSNFVVANREKTLEGKADAGAPLPRLTPEQIRRAVAASLKRLRTDFVDLLQLHWPDRATPLWGNVVFDHATAAAGGHSQQPRAAGEPRVPFDDVCACLAELVRDGTIRAWGLSNETSFGVCEWAAAAKRVGCPPPVSIQNDFSLLDRRFDGELAEACAPGNHDLGLLAYGALCGGTLSGKGYAEGCRHQRFPAFQSRYHCPKSRDAAARYAAVAAAAGLSPATLALAWAYSRPFMAAVIIGATSLAQLHENMDAAEVTLSPDVLKQVAAVHADIRNPNLRN